MSIYSTSKADLLDLVKQLTSVTFLDSDLIFSPPKVNADVTKVENTQIRMTIAASNASFEGSDVLFYNRLDLARLANYPAPDYPPLSQTGTSVYTLLPAIKSSMGLDFTTDDLVETIVTNPGTGEVILLKAKPTSLGWVGEFTLPLGVKPLLSSIFVSDTINWV